MELTRDQLEEMYDREPDTLINRRFHKYLQKVVKTSKEELPADEYMKLKLAFYAGSASSIVMFSEVSCCKVTEIRDALFRRKKKETRH